MKVVWIYLAVSCLTIIKCLNAEILPTSKFTDEVIGDNSSTLISSIENIKTLTSCPQEFGVEGIYEITVPGLRPFPVLCNAQIAGAGYAVIASRSNAELNFYRNWKDFKNGFGDLSADFFLGLDKLHAITKSQAHELYIHLEDFNGNKRFARYDEFYIENELEFYKMSKLGAYSGDAGAAFAHKNAQFYTFDRDNEKSCVAKRRGAWWHNACTWSNLFGLYYGGDYRKDLGDTGLTWEHWRGRYYSYKIMKMMVRPKSCCP
ncbi:uncharacterized protein Dwil_GK27614 [Drosophila willistoni]|uniref:Fibrinogen C-terminal domain-containing protein n=1 Tax=Drosophila willistoni TaxID=7260 RepID=A0A0Q9X125_DROWI|nr:techylectin-5B [Drosophila willistoni]KRF98427.1 uncharacterized protein Dwil_GK27614 [Drosophila willistoni]